MSRLLFCIFLYKYFWYNLSEYSVIQGDEAMTNEKDERHEEEENTGGVDAKWLAVGLALGPAFGMVLGLLVDNIGVGISLGMSFGLLLGTAIGAMKNNN